jgi:replicative DNA helicase
VAQTDQTDQPATLEAALRYASGGLRVIPIAPGRKHPPVNEWQKVATTDLTIITSWWTGLYRGHGVGIVTGEASGVWVLDIDVADGKQGAASLAELEDAYGPLPATVEAITGSGGRHLFFAWDHAHPIRNEQAGKIGDGIDVRGEGGQVVAAPTVHPTTRRAYAFRPGHAFGEIAVAPAPGWLYAMREREPDPAPAPPRPPRPTSNDEADSAAAAFNASTTWDQLLTRDGWTLDKTMGSGEQRWRRPGKNRRGDISATVGHAGRDVLKVFTSSVPALEQDKAYSRFGYEAAVNWGGDRSSFARHLRQQMNDDARADRDDLSWAISDTPAALFAPPADERADDAGAGVSDEWPAPEPLEPTMTAGQPFPVDMLPPWMARQIVAAAEAKQVPVDLTAMFALGALSTVVMGHMKVRLTGSDWVEHTNLYLAAALPPGAGKTPAFKAMTRCITELEAELQDEAQETIREATIRHGVLEKQAKTAFDSAAMKSERGALDKAIQLQAELESMVIPAKPRLLADDATPEVLAIRMSEHNGRMSLLSDEGDIFDIMSGQYSGTGKTTNLSPYLKGHSAGAMLQDRVGRASVSIPEALLTVCVATQPRVLAKLGENAELVGRGLSSRFMYCVPTSNIGARDRYAVLLRGDTDAQATYDTMLKDIGRDLRRFAFPVVADLTIEARDRFLEWDQALEHRLRPGGELAMVAEWAMKLRASVLRLTGLLHVADGAKGDISAQTLERALVVADYWIDHACRVHEGWGGERDAVMRRARQIVTWACRPGEERASFSVREAYVEVRNHDNKVKVEAVNEAIERLAEMGWVRTGSDFPGSKGKKSPVVTFHPDGPDIHAHNAQVDETTPNHPESARCARCAYRERYAFSSSLSTGPEASDFSETSTRNAHNAQAETAPSPQSTPLSVTEAADAIIPAEPASIEPAGHPAPLGDPDDDEDWNLL